MSNSLYAMDTHFMCANVGPDVDTQARMVKAAGYDEYYVTSDLDTPEKSLDFARASREAGLGFNAVFMRLDAAATPTADDLVKFKEMLDGIDSPTRIEFSVWHASMFEKVGDPSTDEGTLAWVKFLMPALEEKGIKACFYPHFGFSLETFGDALRLADAIPHELLGVQYCGYHWYRCDKTPVRELFDRAGDKLFGVNLCGSTFVGEGNEINGLDPTIEPLDVGTMDNADVMNALKEIAYAGPIGIQGYGVTAPAEDALNRSFQQLQTLL